MPATMAASLVPMPDPESKRAPHFKGPGVKDFLRRMENCAKAAGIETTDLPKLIPDYCSRKIRESIEDYPEVEGSDWNKLKSTLIILYGSRDKDKQATPDKLREFSKMARRSNINSRRQLDSYIIDFQKLSIPIMKRKAMQENERDLLLYRGLPSAIRKKIKPALEAIARTKGVEINVDAAPAADDVLQLARNIFKKDDIDPESDSDSNDEDTRYVPSDSDSSSDGEEESSEDRRRSRSSKKAKKVRFENSTTEAPQQQNEQRQGTTKNVPKTDADIESITEYFERLMINKIDAKVDERFRQQNVPMNSPSAVIPLRRARCFLCDRTQPEAHKMGLRNCTELPSLLIDRLVTFNDANRLVRFDGRELPMVPPGGGGVAAVLRSGLSSTSKSKERESPPHQSNVNTIELLENGQPTFQRSTYVVSAYDPSSFPATRAQSKKKETRYNPATQEQRPTRIEEVTDDEAPNKNKSETIINADPSPNVVQAPIPPMPVTGPRAFRLPEPTSIQPVKDARQENAQSRPHTDNTQDGWRARRKEADQDVEMKDAAQSRPRQPLYRFTSDVQEGVSVDKIQEQIMATTITLPFKSIIGISPELQKRFANMTKTRREYTNKTGEALYDDDQEEREKLWLTLNEEDNIVTKVQPYVGAIFTSRYFAMSTGRFEGSFGGIRVTFMVDSGSELNLVTQDVFERANLPLDADGTRWSLRGINGDPVPLLGCCRDVPITIGGHDFDHHFFVSGRNNSKTDVIIGQPWLHFYDAQIDYLREGGMHVRVYPDSRDKNTCLTIKAAGRDTSRNQEKLVLSGKSRAAPSNTIVYTDF
jgi:hypothetical protein